MKGLIRSHQPSTMWLSRAATRSSTVESEWPVRLNSASMIGSDSSANGACSSFSIVRCR